MYRENDVYMYHYPAIEGPKSCSLKLDKTEGKAGQRHNLAYPCNVKIYPCNKKKLKDVTGDQVGGLSQRVLHYSWMGEYSGSAVWQVDKTRR